MKKQVKDPALLKKLTPDYEIGCKRLLFSDDYLPSIQRDNVNLVTAGIERFTDHALLTRDGQKIDADLVVLATGFETVHIFNRLKITGPDGVSLDQVWAKEIRAHKSVAVCGFPNFFLMLGPNSGLGHSSILIMLEEQARYITRLLKEAHDSHLPTILVRPDAEEAHNRAMQRALANTVWNTGCNSWYKDEQGRIFSLWPHTTTRFIRDMRKALLSEYRFYNDERTD
jgi:cation diffusion facilitator CzcD-associated flavoprotein CzcO